MDIKTKQLVEEFEQEQNLDDSSQGSFIDEIDTIAVDNILSKAEKMKKREKKYLKHLEEEEY